MYRTYSIIFFIVFIFAIQTGTPYLSPVIDFLGAYYTQRQLEMAVSPVEEESTVTQGWAYYKMGRLDMARDIMLGVLESNSNTSALYCLGLIEMDEGSYEAAADRLQAVLNLSPQHIPSLLNLGRAYYLSGRYHLAKQCFEDVLQEEPQNREASIWWDKTCSAAGI